MRSGKPSCFIAISFFLFVLASCNNTPDEITFPQAELGYTQPETIPLKFTPEKNIKWDTVKRGAITPVVKKMDINALPSVPYDSSGFKPFIKPPEEVKFDYNALPEKDLDLNKIPSQPLDLKMAVLSPLAITNIGKMIPHPGKPLSIYDMAQFRGTLGQLIGALYIDKYGLLWIGGKGGLFRYDGENMQTIIEGNPSFAAISGMTEDDFGNIWFIKAGGNFGVVNIKNGTIGYSNKIAGAGNNITKIAKDDKGNIWVYNANEKAVDVIDPVTRTYKPISIKILADLSDAQAASGQTSFQVIQANDKKIWISTYRGGVDIIDPATGKIKFLKKTNGIASDSVQAITQDKRNGLMWLSVPSGLDAIDVNNGTIKHYSYLQRLNNAITIDLFCDDRGQVWKGTSNGNGIDLLDPDNARARNIKQSDGLTGTVIIALCEDGYQRMWVGTTTGLNRIDQYANTTHAVGTTQIISLMEDEVGNLWIATQAGLFIVDPKRNGAHLLDKAHGLSDNFVQSFWQKSGNMVIATDGGYNIIDPVNKTLKKIGKAEGLVNDTVYSAYSDTYGNTWVTGPTNGIDLIDSAKNLVLHTDANGGLSNDGIGDIRQDKDGMIWLATTGGGGVDIINPATGTVKYLNDQPGLKDTCNRTLMLDEYGRMWIGTDKGVYVADTKQGTLTHIGTGQGLSSAVVTSLGSYKGTVLVGTLNKVNIITPTAPDNTSQNWKVSILKNSEDLLRINTTAWETDCVIKEGEFLWGDNGITLIKNIEPLVDSNTIYITGVNVMTRPQNFINKESLSASDTLMVGDSSYTKKSGFPKNTGYAIDSKFRWDSVSGPYNLPVNLKLPYDQNYLQFHFAKASLGRSDSAWYIYTLEGIDKNWSLPTTNTSTENYLNLPSGNYVFKVSCKGADGKWSKPVSFSFSISPPWYKTWWAYLLYILLGLGILRWYIVYRSRKFQKENQLLEEKIKRRTEQLQKSIEDLKATQTQLIQSEKMASLGELTAGIAHEIQNPLNFVNNFAEVNKELLTEMNEEIDKGNFNEVKEIAKNINDNEEKINYHGKRADAIVKSMLQHSRRSNGQKEPADINALCDEYLRLSYHGLRAKDKSFNAKFEADFDQSIGKINIVQQDIGRAILNLITNAFYAVTEKKKIAGEAYQPTVIVKTKKLANQVKITVSDNGNGVPQKVIDKIFQPFFTTKPTGQGTGLGLSLSYDIVKAHGGTLNVETKEGEFAEFIITLPN